MTNPVPIPTSLRERLDHAEALVADNRSGEAIRILREVGVDLAKTRPELLAFIVASQIDKRDFVADNTRTDTTTVTAYKRILGIRFGADVHVTEKTTRERRVLGRL